MKIIVLSLIFACTASGAPGDPCYGTQAPCSTGEFCSNEECATCTQCASGQRIDSVCQGGADTGCQDCQLNGVRGCGPNRYIATLGVCDGTGVAHLDENDCMPCKTCSTMEYIADSCEWNSLSDTQICTPCLYPCQAGHYIPTDGNAELQWRGTAQSPSPIAIPVTPAQTDSTPAPRAVGPGT